MAAMGATAPSRLQHGSSALTHAIAADYLTQLVHAWRIYALSRRTGCQRWSQRLPTPGIERAAEVAASTHDAGAD